MKRRYTIEIEINADPAYHAYTVSVKQSRELICEFSGASREGLGSGSIWAKGKVFAFLIPLAACIFTPFFQKGHYDSRLCMPSIGGSSWQHC